MNADRAVLLGTPAIGAAVFAAAGAAIIAPIAQHWTLTASGVMALAGWAAGHGALQGLVNPGAREARAIRQFELAEARKPKQTVVFNIEHKDGYIARIAGEIPFEQWEAVARVVVAWQSKNLTTLTIAKALPNLVQSEQRAIHAQMCGLLEPAGVIAVKNNHNEITRPVGWSFFARVSRGMVSPLQQFSFPHSPQRADVPQDSDPYPTHTRTTRDFSPQWGGARA